MAGLVVDNAVTYDVIGATQYTSVWVKPYWGADWTYVPFLFPERSSERAAPGDSEATYSWEYGKFLNLWSYPGDTFLPINLQNWFIQTRVHTVYGDYIAWIGVVVGETMKEEGIYPDTGYPRGFQTLECRGLEYLLERRSIIGSYVGDANTWTYLPVTRHFNISSTSEDIVGNRAASANQEAGVFLFGDGGNKWSNLQIADHILRLYQPWAVYGTINGSIDYAPLFYIVGQTDAVDGIYERHIFHGNSVREALNRLIDRRRGLGWRIQTDGVGPIYIVVFSIAQFPIYGATAYIPANQNQVDVSIHDDPHIEAEFRITSRSQVDEIIVESDVPMRAVVSPGFDLGSLEEGWSAKLDTNLQELTYYEALATDLSENWESVSEAGPDNQRNVLTFFEFNLYTGLGLEDFNVLDTNGDGIITLDDLESWGPDLTYQQVTEEERASDAYAAVYSHFQVPKDWTFDGWCPFVDDEAYVDLTTNGAYWNRNKRFERTLPFKEIGTTDDAEREYMEPIVLIAQPSRELDIIQALAEYGAVPYSWLGALDVVPDLTEAEFDALANPFSQYIGWDELSAAWANLQLKYMPLDRVQQIDPTYPACSPRFSDNGLKVILKSKANHIFAHNHWDGGTSEITPLFDYRTIVFTASFRTDIVPRVRRRVWINQWLDPLNPDTANQGALSPVGKQIHIEVPGKELWIAGPYTVQGIVNDGDLDLYNEDTPVVIRDDTEHLRYIADLAEMWWGQQRASAHFLIKNQLRFFLLGGLVRTAASGYWAEQIGTPVTSIERDYQRETHSVITGYAELDPGAFGELVT